MMLDQLRLEVEHVEMAGRPGHEELNNPLGFRSVMQAPVELRLFPGRRLAAQQGRQGDPAESAS